jgi:hypothetical protein
VEQVYEVLLVIYYQDLNTHDVILTALGKDPLLRISCS